MNYSELNKAVLKIYEMLQMSPHLFVGRGSNESIVLALEALLNIAAESNDRPDGYSKYLSDLGFGMFYFDSKFDIDNNSIVALVDRNAYRSEQNYEELHRKYADEFSKLFGGFLEWRKDRAR